MPYDIDTERHFYFGNIFFQQYVGIFDQENKSIGMALSTKASEGSTLECPANTCVSPDPDPTPDPDPEPDPTPDPEPPTPDPTPDPIDPIDPTPSEDGGNSDDNKALIWMLVALSLMGLLLIAILIIYLVRRRAKKDAEFNQALYAQTPMHDGDLIQKDIEQDVSGKGENRVDHFNDHAELMRETGLTPKGGE